MDRFAAAHYAPLVMYAWDMCDRSLHTFPPDIDPRIPAQGWKVVGFLSGNDDIFQAGSSIRSTVLGSGKRVSYGYVATRGEAPDKEMIVSIRGTDGAEEWIDDLDFLMQKHPAAGASGLVDQGFFDIYASLQFHPVVPPATGFTAGIGIQHAAADAASVMVLGHSLGAAIATYLTLDLNLAGLAAKACLFASPRTGNQDFVDFFEGKVANYDLFNYVRDIVPQVPKFDILHLSCYHDLRQAKTIPADGSAATVCDDPACNHHLICYTALLDPAVFVAEMQRPGVTPDDRNCAKCVRYP